MSKDSKQLDVSKAIEVNREVAQAVTSLVKSTNSQKGFKKFLNSEPSRRGLAQVMTAFVNIDVKFEGGMRSMGQIIYNVRHMPEDIQRKVIAAICEVQGIEAIEEVGRKGLALALFAKFPEMHVLQGKNKDTLAGMRVSSYESAYRLSLPPKPGESDNSGSTNASGEKPRSAKDLFSRLYGCATSKEQVTLLHIAQRAKIEYDDWLPEEEVTATDGEAAPKK